MFNRFFAILSILSIAELAFALNDHGVNHRGRHHHGISREIAPISATQNTTILPRGGGARWSWYDTEESGNAGACGDHMKNSEFVVARAQVDFKQSDCFQKITMEFEGRKVEAVIKDICPVCPPNGLDLSKGLFKYIAPNGDGIVYGNWWFGGDAPKPDPTTTKEPPKTTTTKTTTTTSKTTSTTTTSTSTTTKSSSSTTTTSTSTTSTTKSSSTTTASSTTSAANLAPTADTKSNLAMLSNILVELAGVVVAQ